MPADQAVMDVPSLAADSPSVVAPAPASAQSPSPAQGPSKNGSEPLNNAFADLDKMIVEAEPTPAQKPPVKKPEKESKSVVDRPEEAQVEQKAEKEEEIPGDKPDKPVPAPELRKAYATLKKELGEYKAKLAKLESERPKFDEKELNGLKEKLETSEKYRKQLDEELRLTAYERSQEFKEKWQQPFIDAYEFGRERTAQFKVTDGEGNLRQGAPEDFDYVMRITDDDAAAQVAEQMFGTTKAAVIMGMRNEVHRLMNLRGKALTEAQKLGGEREKIKLESQTKQKTMLHEMWNRLNNEAAEKYPDWFKERDGDEKGNELLRKGYELVDKVFLGGGDTPPEELVGQHSAIRNRAAAFGRMAYENRTMKARVAELEKELESYKESEPKGGDGAPVGQDGALGWEKQMEAMLG